MREPFDLDIWLKDKSREIIDTDGKPVQIIAIPIAGKHTMMIHGGDCRSIYNDGTYLRWLCRLNGLRWEGIE